MADIPSTRASLLVRLNDRADDSAWREFVALYAPIVYRFARRHGLQDADAADLAQDVLRGVMGSIGGFDPARGLFRSWLFTVVHRRLYDFVQQRKRSPVPASDNATMQMLAEMPASDDQAAWEGEWERQLFALAAERVKPECTAATWQAFWMTAVEGVSGADVAASLGISVASVYLAKSRVMAKLKAEIRQLQAE